MDSNEKQFPSWNLVQYSFAVEWWRETYNGIGHFDKELYEKFLRQQHNININQIEYKQINQNEKQMKTSIQLIIAAVIVIAINGVFFEYAISRDLPLLLTIISAIAVDFPVPGGPWITARSSEYIALIMAFF